MRKLTFVFAALATLVLVDSSTNRVDAANGIYGGYALHIGGRNLHLDIGYPHGHRRHRSHYSHRARHSRHHYTWHDTSHYDYHPGGFQWHYDHFDYVPGHYDFHETGHWDRHRGRHHDRHHGQRRVRHHRRHH